MPAASKTVQALQVVRRQVRDLAEPAKGDRSSFAAGYRTAIADAVKVITRAVRRAGDGRGA